MAPLKVVLVGCGSISKTWLDAALGIPDIEIVGLVDVQVESAQARADQYQFPNILVENDFSRALDRLHPDIVFDCTVPSAHMSITVEALQHGCHVFGEKPMAGSIDNARKMVEAAQASGKLYAVM